ncbi:DoxX family protein [Staphylospora marina]|uniref:DoxX family protein n=1 Tax=Staphylospora marina TaxID=2490858 RepID=UPI000F5BD0EF|nr:DoxX family protein [Staphylospora marina]
MDWASLGLLLIRLVIGLTFVGHGLQKLFGWFGGGGLKGTGAWLESLGIRPGTGMALLAGLAETVGGLLFAAGSFLWVSAVLLSAVMLVAIKTVHAKNGYWITSGGMEYNVVLIAAVAGIAMVGPGQYVLF